MRKIYLLNLLFLIFCFQSFAQQAFTKGNLVVYKVGKSTVDTLSNAGFPISLDEYSTSGTFVRSHPMPVTVLGANSRIISSGSSTTEGMMSRSDDKKFLIVTGYDTIPDPARSSITSSTSANVNRVVGVIGADGSIDATTALTDAYSGNSLRSAASTNGTDIWLAGTGSTGTAGVRYTTKGSTTSTQLSTSVTNIRVVNIFNGQLYCTTGSGAFKSISTVGSGLPMAAGQAIAVLPGMPNLSTSTEDPNTFSIKPGTGDTAYIADSRAKNRNGGIQKWTYNGSTWTLLYTLDSGLTSGIRSIVVDWSTPRATIYGTNNDSYMKDMPGNKIVAVTDNDSTSVFSAIATADANFMFRGIALAPEASTSSTIYTFTGDGNWDVTANWSNNTIPPAVLPAFSEIIIDPIPNGQCVLNISQTIAKDAIIIVKTGKKMIVPGALTVQ